MCLLIERQGDAPGTISHHGLRLSLIDPCPGLGRRCFQRQACLRRAACNLIWQVVHDGIEADPDQARAGAAGDQAFQHQVGKRQAGLVIGQIYPTNPQPARTLRPAHGGLIADEKGISTDDQAALRRAVERPEQRR
ncbi:hypothetical protein D3C85_1268920 [compost metagenome]